MSNNQNNLKKLQKEWYEKLKDSGFEDIERDEDGLKLWTVYKVNRLLFERVDAEKTAQMASDLISFRYDYFRFARQFIHDHKFDNDLEKLVWEYHSEGYSSREIHAAFRKLIKENPEKYPRHQIGRNFIMSTVEKLRKIMLDTTCKPMK